MKETAVTRACAQWLGDLQLRHPNRRRVGLAGELSRARRYDSANYVLLLTDGMPTCDDPTPQVTALRRRMPEVRTFVVGFGTRSIAIRCATWPGRHGANGYTRILSSRRRGLLAQRLRGDRGLGCLLHLRARDPATRSHAAVRVLRRHPGRSERDPEAGRIRPRKTKSSSTAPTVSACRPARSDSWSWSTAVRCQAGSTRACATAAPTLAAATAPSIQAVVPAPPARSVRAAKDASFPPAKAAVSAAPAGPTSTAA